MARKFVRASNQYLRYGSDAGSTPVDVPFTMACWFNSDSLTVSQALMALVDRSGGAAGDFHVLWLRGNVAGDYIAASSFATSTKFAISSIAYSINTWQHACGVFAANDDRRVFLNGGNKGTNAESMIPQNLSHTAIGHIYRSDNPAQYMSGMIAEPAWWNAALTDAEAAMLATGIRPWKVRPQNLVTYPPLVRDDDEDIVGGISFVADNSPTIAPHPPIILIPPEPQLWVPGGVAVVADTDWIAPFGNLKKRRFQTLLNR